MTDKQGTDGSPTTHSDVIDAVTPVEKNDFPPTTPQKDQNKAKSTDFWMVIITCVIAGAALFQAYIFYSQREVMRDQWKIMRDQYNIMDNQLREMRSGAKDTHDLAVASMAQAESTKSVAEHALAQVNVTKDTANATKDIADRTLRQAEATNRLATQANRSADISDNTLRITQELAILDRRPWVGFNFIDNSTESEGYLSPYLVGNIANTGKTPAVEMTRKMYLVFRYNYNDKGLDINSISKEYYGRHGREFPTQEPISFDNIMDMNTYNNLIFRIDDVGPVFRVIPPNGIREFPIMQGFQFGLGNQKYTDPYNRKGVFIYVVGEITYYDTGRAERYTTEFCVERDFEDDHPRFRPCAFGNDMK